MNKIDDEVLSRLMDNDHEDIDIDAVVRSLDADTEQRARWQRYHMIGEIIQNNYKVPAGSQSVLTGGVSLADRIREAVADEPTILVRTNESAQSVSVVDESQSDASKVVPFTPRKGASVERKPAMSRFGFGLAIAASTAFLSVMALNLLQKQPETSSLTSPLAQLETSEVVEPDLLADQAERLQQTQANIQLVGNNGANWVNMDHTQLTQESQARLNRLLSYHLESSGGGLMQGMLPYSRLVGYDTPSAGVTK